MSGGERQKCTEAVTISWILDIKMCRESYEFSWEYLPAWIGVLVHVYVMCVLHGVSLVVGNVS